MGGFRAVGRGGRRGNGDVAAGVGGLGELEE